MSEWQPIETAPRDGTLVLLGNENDPDWPLRCRRWCTEWNRWRGYDGEDATHWMPLPPHHPRPAQMRGRWRTMMSDEFREISGLHFMWQALSYAAEERGQQEVSGILADLYAALAPLERACASVEAYDSAPEVIRDARAAAWPQIDRAVGLLKPSL